MEVVLRDDVSGLGRRGEIVSVADGHARNYLLPRGLALVAGPGVVAQASAMRRSAEVRDTRARTEAQEVARQLVGQVIRVPARAGSSGKLFGSVTTADVVEATTAQTGLVVDRRALHLDEVIRSVGTYEVSAKPHPDVAFVITVEVVAE